MQSWKRIDKYQLSLNKKLGQGSYASVYLGRCISSGQNVAVKVIERRLFLDAYNLRNIESEIQIMKRVNHENIVKLHDIYQTTNNMYIITEFCDGGDLHEYLSKNEKLNEPEAKRMIRQIMKGAKYLHNNGIIHRDLKPANILIKDGVCKISDFGFAKKLNSQAIMRSIVGTPLYMSPQLLKGTKYTSKSDLWSIGLIYYEMLHGFTPWPANSQLQLINAIYSRKPVFSRDVSVTSRDFIQKCLEINEKDRIQWEEVFQHKLLKEFARYNDTHILKIHQKEDKQNIGGNTSVTYIKNIAATLKPDLSEKALGKLVAMTPKKRTLQNQRTHSKSHSVAKFAGSRVNSGETPRSKSPAPCFTRRK